MNDPEIAIDKVQAMGAGTDYRTQLLDIFAASWLFKSLDAGDMDTLIGELNMYEAATGQALLEEGEISNFLIVVVSGLVDIVKHDAQGDPVSISHAGAGKILGEMSLIDGEPRFASCIALEPTLFAVLSRVALNHILETHPRLGIQLLLQLIALLSQRLRKTSSELVQSRSR